MEYLKTYSEKELIKMYKYMYKEDYKRRGHEFKEEDTVENSKEKAEARKKMFGWED